MNSQNVLYGKPNDERMTPAYGGVPILKYIPPKAVVWCPFDLPESHFVKLISEQNEVVSSHLSEGKDFFSYEPEHWDVMVSNPPFKGKRQIFERALSFGKPFALLMTLTWLNDAASKRLFAEIDLELLMFDRRIKYTNPMGVAEKKITFSSAYYCVGMLPKQIVMESLPV